jgi:hypothetical protein
MQIYLTLIIFKHFEIAIFWLFGVLLTIYRILSISNICRGAVKYCIAELTAQKWQRVFKKRKFI